jgi:hypothetical protein
MRKRHRQYHRRSTILEAREEAKFGCTVTLIVICAALVHFLAQFIIFLLSLAALPMPLIFAWLYGKRTKRFEFLKRLQTDSPYLSWLVALTLIAWEVWLIKTNYSVQTFAFGVGKIWLDSLTYAGLFNFCFGWLFILISTKLK